MSSLSCPVQAASTSPHSAGPLLPFGNGILDARTLSNSYPQNVLRQKYLTFSGCSESALTHLGVTWVGKLWEASGLTVTEVCLEEKADGVALNCLVFYRS